MDRNALAELLQALESRRDAEERRREERYTALIERAGITARLPLLSEAGTATPHEQQADTLGQQVETMNPQEQQTDPLEQQTGTVATLAMAVPAPPVATVPDTPALAVVAGAILAASEVGLAPSVVAVGCASPELLSAACARAAEGHQPSPLLALGTAAPPLLALGTATPPS
ncbi:UNVERIFIED_CONTAM: hypothetical protein FKN15_062177 [Acipenser sinensis]